LRKILSYPFYIKDVFESYNWKNYSKLIIKSDNSNWVFDSIKNEKIEIFKKINIEVVNDRFFYNSKKQCVFYLSKYDVLKYINNNSHKIAFSYFHGDPRLNNKNNVLFKKIINNINKISKIHVSNSIMQSILLDEGVDDCKIHKIPISININNFNSLTKEKKYDLKRQLQIPLDKKIIGSFQKDGIGWKNGNLPKYEKGPDIFIKSLVELNKKNKNIHVLLTGPSRGYVINELKKNNISFTYLKFVNYHLMQNYYNLIDLYIVTSREEGGPRSILESMATRTPIISTKVGQAIDLIVNNINGFIVDIDDYLSIAQISEKIFENYYDLDNIINNGRITAEKNAYESQINLWKSFFNGFYHN